jgi:hypothetical protein
VNISLFSKCASIKIGANNFAFMIPISHYLIGEVMKIQVLTLLLAFSLPVTAGISIQPIEDAVDHSHGIGNAFGSYTPVLTRNGFNGTYVTFHGHLHHYVKTEPTVHKHLGHKGEHSHKAKAPSNFRYGF